VLIRLWRLEPNQLALIITALLFGCVLAIGWSVRTSEMVNVPEVPANWSAIQIIADSTATPNNRDQRICDLPDTLYPMGNGKWYDVCSFQNRVYASVLTADYTLLHGPSSIGESYRACNSGILASHDLVMLCRYYGGLLGAPTPLTLHVVDSIGRPHTPLMIPSQADYSALAVDPNGGLHVSWLEPQPGNIWTVHYASYSGDVTVLDSGAALPPDSIIGVIHIATDHMLLNFVLGVDAHTTYIIWDDSTRPYDTGSDYTGVVYAFSFPLDKPSAVQQVTLVTNMQDWSAMPLPVINDHTIALPLVTVSTNNAPAVAFLVNGKTARIDTFSDPFTNLYRGPYLSLHADHSLQLQWSIWTANQGVLTYSSTTHAFP
jgi:hypothetical protein